MMHTSSTRLNKPPHQTTGSLWCGGKHQNSVYGIQYRHILVGILIVAALLRFWDISRGDPINDESFYAFRAIGMMDFLDSDTQHTPWEWFDSAANPGSTIPWWAHLSFHDHPPLVFWIQHVFLNIFGDTRFAYRLPSALIGVASVYLLFLLGRLLFSTEIGLVAAGLYAVTVNHVALSRMGLQEPYVIFFLLLAVYFFLKAFASRNDNYFFVAGIAFGLGLLAKYTMIILAPIFLTYLLCWKRGYVGNKKLLLSAALAVLLASPIIIYNIELYRAVGHFDYQVSYVLQEHPHEWQIAPGKDIGSLSDRLVQIAPHMLITNSWLLLIFFLIAGLCGVIGVFRKPRETWQKYSVLVIGFLWIFFLMLLVGPSFRFLTMLTPWVVLASAVLLACMLRYMPRWAGITVLMCIVAWESWYSINSQIFYYPVGPDVFAWSPVRLENYNWGYNQLDAFLAHELDDKVPSVMFETKYNFLADIREKAIQDAVARGAQPYPAIIFHLSQFHDAAKVWSLDRWMFYHGWPVLSMNDYDRFTKEKGADYFQKLGFKDYYFVWQTNVPMSDEFRALTAGAEPIIIINQKGQRAFVVFKKLLK